ncbi:pyrroloquinoline quinone biosynthesis protein PqqD [Streptomyces cirratus]|uniref:Pyrroloquinoline quinone biosynthesis protein PqqD n=1 Tax=Streptomyces cirratus TaxID=68187 RepID=A0ABQ3F3C7_9ACTN|nr:pyrroloquinoline quinone biosynthesis peptide chaperone PqqD [Streptomyces cirratus]GHB82668.1 pyrroloquinoline quinone biosynthesis protein PqqD [Streptomyces cirratus]
MDRPVLGRGVRLIYDKTRQTHVVLHPEGVLVPNRTAVSVLELCDGVTTVPGIAEALGATYAGVREEEVGAVLTRLTENGVVRWT